MVTANKIHKGIAVTNVAAFTATGAYQGYKDCKNPRHHTLKEQIVETLESSVFWSAVGVWSSGLYYAIYILLGQMAIIIPATTVGIITSGVCIARYINQTNSEKSCDDDDSSLQRIKQK